MLWTSSVAILCLAGSSAVTAVVSLCCINVVKWSRCSATSASRPFYCSQYSNQQYLLFQSVSTFFTLVFLTLSLSFLAFVPSFCFICLSYRLPLFSSCVPVITCFSTAGTNSRLCPSSQFIGPSDGAHSAVSLCVYCLQCSPFVQAWFWFLNWALQSWNHPTIVLWADKTCV